MKIKPSYDEEADAISIDLSTKKSDITIEFGEHILVDITSDWNLVGIEILDASEEISKLFGQIISKQDLQALLCEVEEESPNEYRIQLRSKNRSTNLVIPLYQSPIAYA
jgi:uncharacterized protein YuzE